MTPPPKFFGRGGCLHAAAAHGLWSLLLAAPAAAQTVIVGVDPEATHPPVSQRLAGQVGWRSTPRLIQMMSDMGAGRATYRRTVFLHAPEDAMYVGEDFQRAAAAGMTTWLTCVGTPAALSPDPGATENQFNTGVPEFARYPPTDPLAWADELLEFIDQMEAFYGVAPEYVEIWNEPERVEWFKGDAGDYVEMYAPVAARLRAARPALRIGGPGLAGWSSSMDGAGSFLLSLVSACSILGVPLDFVSWHSYAPSTELLYSGISAQIKDLAAQLGMPPLETAVSEWNVYPAAEGPHGPELDGPHAAANLAGLLSTVPEVGLDRNMFFLDYDEDNDGNLTDLLGVSLGMITQHGVKKPSARLYEAILAGALDAQAVVAAPAEEWNVRAQGSVAGSHMRLIVSNDAVTGTWVFANRARENGMLPGWLHPLWLAAGGVNATEATLMAQGLTQAQAQAVLGFIPEVLAYDRYAREARPVALDFSGTRGFSVREARRFTDSVNSPAQHQPVLLPFFTAAEAYAANSSAAEGVAVLASEGWFYTIADILAHSLDFFAWAAGEGIPYGLAVRAYRVMQNELLDERLAQQAFLNGLPETRVQAESPAAAGLTVSGREIRFSLDPNTAIVIDVDLGAPTPR